MTKPTPNVPDPNLPPDTLRAQILDAVRSDANAAVGLRNNLFLPLLRGADLDRAAAVNDALVTAAATTLLFVSDRASLALRRHDTVKADLAATELRRIAPDDPGSAAQAIQVWLTLGDSAKAAIAARETADLWTGQPRLAQMAMTALYRESDMTLAVRAAQAAVAAAPTDLGLATAAAGVFLTSGQATMAISALNNAKADEGANPRALFELGRALAMLNPMDLRALNAMQRSWDLDPQNHRTTDLLARMLMARGRHAAAGDMLLAIPPDQRSGAMTMQLARALTKSNRLDLAMQHYQALLAHDPTNQPLRRQYSGALVRAGQQQAAIDVYAGGMTQRAAGLPATFTDGIAQLRTSAPRDVVPQVRLDWVHDVLTRAGRAPTDRAKWQAEVSLVNRIDHLMLDWVECRPDHAAEIVPYLGNLQQGGQDLRAALAMGRGAFLATAHIGLLLGGPPALHALGIESVWLASVPNFLNRKHFESLVSTSSENQASIGRAVLRALRRGAVVGIAIDGVSVRGDRSYPLFDKTIQLSEFMPRLAYRRSVPSFFPRMPWHSDAMAGDVVRLPDPLPDEAEDAFVARWMKAYLANIEDFILQFPGSIRAAGGFWGGIAF